jgi:hypothetical protein
VLATADRARDVCGYVERATVMQKELRGTES